VSDRYLSSALSSMPRLCRALGRGPPACWQGTGPPLLLCSACSIVLAFEPMVYGIQIFAKHCGGKVCEPRFLLCGCVFLAFFIAHTEGTWRPLRCLGHSANAGRQAGRLVGADEGRIAVSRGGRVLVLAIHPTCPTPAARAAAAGAAAHAARLRWACASHRGAVQQQQQQQQQHGVRHACGPAVPPQPSTRHVWCMRPRPTPGYTCCG
jgi:hypothetical protein